MLASRSTCSRLLKPRQPNLFSLSANYSSRQRHAVVASHDAPLLRIRFSTRTVALRTAVILGASQHACVSRSFREQCRSFASDDGKNKSPEERPSLTHTLKTTISAATARTTTHENIYTIPNFLTATRLIAAPVIGHLVLTDQLGLALALFFYAGVTDLVDGYLARRWNQQTVVGSVIDPMADKGLMIILTVTLAMKGLLPLSLATLILGRDVSLAIAAIYYRYASLPVPKTFARYWDFSLPSAEVHPTPTSKANTFLQLLLIGATLAIPTLLISGSGPTGILQSIGLSQQNVGAGMLAFQSLVAGTTVWSGLSYAFLKDAVKILGTDETLKAKQGRRGRAIIGVTFGSVVLLAAWLAVTKDLSSEPKDVSLAQTPDRGLEDVKSAGQANLKGAVEGRSTKA